MVLPKELVEDCWGCMQLAKCNLLIEILYKLMQLLVCKVTKLCLEAMQNAPTQMRVTSRWMRVTLPLWGWRSWFRRVTSHYGNIHPYMVLQRSYSSNSNGLILQFHCLYSISSVVQNRVTNSITEYWSIPNGWVCLNVMHISMMSSSDTEVTSSGVPSFLVTINMHILVLRWGSSDGTWSLPEAVAEDKVDISVFELKIAMMLFVCFECERIQ